MNALDIEAVCERRRLRLVPYMPGGEDVRLLVIDQRNDPPEVPGDLLELLFKFRDEILARLGAVHLCRQILCGEFDHANDATVNRIAAELQKLPRTFARDVAWLHLIEEAQK